jgi:surfeit locus 1 family protein
MSQFSFQFYWPSPFPRWASFFLVLSAVILCGLGGWQVKRLHWKQAILKAWGQSETLLQPQQDFNAIRYRPVKISVIEMIKGSTITVAPRLWQDKVGAFVYQLGRIPDGRVLVVHRGWIEENKPIHDLDTPLINQAFQISAIEKPHFMGKTTQAESTQWFWPDPESMAKKAGISESTSFFIAKPLRETDIFFNIAMIHEKPHNRHLSYALFWFSMAGIVIVIYGLKFFVKIEQL